MRAGDAPVRREFGVRSRCEASRGDGAELCGGVASGRGRCGGGVGPSAALEFQLVHSVNEIDDHSMYRQPRALRRGEVSEAWVLGALVSSSGSAGPGLSPSLVAQRKALAPPYTCDRLHATTRKFGREVGRGRARHAQPKKSAGPRLSWRAIEQRAARTRHTEESLYSGSSSGGTSTNV